MLATNETSAPREDFTKNLSLEEIEALSKDLKKAKVQRTYELTLQYRTVYANAVRDLRRHLEGLGLTLDEGLSMKQAEFITYLNQALDQDRPPQGKVINGVVPKKYQHPTNPTLAWSGRGQRPKWLVEYLSENPEVDLETLRISGT